MTRLRLLALYTLFFLSLSACGASEEDPATPSSTQDESKETHPDPDESDNNAQPEPEPEPEPESEPESEPEPEPESQPEPELDPDPTVLDLAMEDNVVFLDVRTPEDFDSGHIPGALNLPVSDIDRASDIIGDDLTRPVIVYCLSGGRSARALTSLQNAGYERVVDGGGVQALAALLEVELEQ